jgi:phage regulator Rha-like protein
MTTFQSIQNRIYVIRGQRVMLDKDLAALYEVSTKSLNLAVKRNIERFPEDFMFQLTRDELEDIKEQREMLEKTDTILRFQVETSKGRGGTRYLPYVFTEQGVAMLSAVLHSSKAIQMNISIMRAFVEIRRMALEPAGWKEQLKKIAERISEHDIQLSQIYDTLENLLDENAAKRKWDERERIGFKK